MPHRRLPGVFIPSSARGIVSENIEKLVLIATV